MSSAHEPRAGSWILQTLFAMHCNAHVVCALGCTQAMGYPAYCCFDKLLAPMAIEQGTPRDNSLILQTLNGNGSPFSNDRTSLSYFLNLISSDKQINSKVETLFGQIPFECAYFLYEASLMSIGNWGRKRYFINNRHLELVRELFHYQSLS